MNIFKSVSNWAFGQSPNEELVRIPGRLYLVRPYGVKSSKECIFIDAQVAIRKTSREFQTELVVTRTYGEGESDLVQEDDETDDERPFLIDEALRFSARPSAPEDIDVLNSTSFTWLDRSDTIEDTYLFACEATDQELITKFLSLVYIACFERKYSKPGVMASERDFDEFKFKDTVPPMYAQPPALNEPPLFRPPGDSDSEDEIDNALTSQVQSLSLASAPKATSSTPARTSPNKGKGKATSPAPPVQSPPPQTRAEIRKEVTTALVLPPDSRKMILTETVDLHLYDRATGLFMLQEKAVQAALWEVKGRDFPCWLSVAGAGGSIWVSTAVDNEMPLTFSESQLSLIFNFRHTALDKNFTWLLRVQTKESFARLNMGFARGLFEASAGPQTWSKLSEADQAYSQSAYMDDRDVEMSDYESESETQARRAEAEEEEEIYSEPEFEDDDDESEASSVAEGVPTTKKQALNSHLVVGHKDSLSYVVRGDMIGVFKSQGKSKRLKFMANIQGIGTPDGKRKFQPGKLMLHDQDTTMIISDPLNPHSLYRLDLATGRVIEELNISNDMGISSFAPNTKTSQTTQEQTFVGTSHNALFRIDPRLSGSKLVGDQMKQYAGKVDFSTLATTEKGGMAVGSSKGEIRLFDSLGKIAKSSLPTVGQPIIGIDVSSDGQWLVATTRGYLLLIDCTIKDGRYEGQVGFDRSFPATSKPRPKRLTLSPEHAQYLDGPLNFTTAKFNTGHQELEKTIVTSTGEFVVAWDFKKVQEGKLDAYTIKRYGETIVADGFKFGGDREIVVVQPTDIFVERRRNLEKPNRSSLSSPLRSGVVRKWGDD